MGIQLIRDKDLLRPLINFDSVPDVFDKVIFSAGFTNRGSDHFACGNIEIGNQGLGTMTYVFEFAPLRLT